MSWTTYEDIEKRWISSSPLPKETTLDAFIGDVERQYAEALPDIDFRISEGTLNIETFKYVVASIIIEFLQTEGTGKSAQTQSYPGIAYASDTYRVNARYSLELTEDDISKLSSSGRQSSIRIIHFPRYPRRRYCPGELDY